MTRELTDERLVELAQYNRLGRAGGFMTLISPPTGEELDAVFALARRALVAQLVPALNAAWARVETALEPGHTIRLIQRTYNEGWEVYSGIPDPPPADADYGYGVGKGLGGWKGDYGEGPTLVAALNALADRLAAT